MVVFHTDVHHSHHPAICMIQDVAVVHPASGTFIESHGDADALLEWHVDRVLPHEWSERISLVVQDLKVKAVEMKRM
jgi:hypothetical protein